MHKRPVAIIAALFITGIFSGKSLSSYIGLSQIFLAVLFFIIATIIFIRLSKTAHIFLFLLIISSGALSYLNSNIFPPDHISYFLGKDKVKAEIIGTIKGPVEARGVYYGKVSSRYMFKLEEISLLYDSVSRRTATHGVSGLALIRIQSEKDYQYGDRLLIKGTIRNTKFETQNPKFQKNNFNYAEYLENQDIFAIINASGKNVTLLARDYKVNPVLKYAYLARGKLKDQFLEKMPLESGAFLRGMLLGEKSELPQKTKEIF